MTNAIPFINTSPDCDRYKRFYSDSPIARVTLQNHSKLAEELPEKTKFWVDPAFDSYHCVLSNSRTWNDIEPSLGEFNYNQYLCNSSSVTNPDKAKLRDLVDSVLSKCLFHKPEWLTVPQLPIVNDSSRNKLNKELAIATAIWADQKGYSGKFVFPLIFTKNDQLTGKTLWKPKINTVKSQLKFSKLNVDFLWIVDSSLDDQSGYKTNLKRIESLIEFHLDVKTQFANKKVIAGPYWGVNLVLWARDLCHYPGISLGTGYRYYLPGFPGRSGNTRVALAPLKRRAIIVPELKTWLFEALKVLPKGETHDALEALYDNFDTFLSKDIADRQVAEFYRTWIDLIEKTPLPGRKLALFQDLSSVFVTGKNLSDLPKTAVKGGRQPERIAEQLMLNCL